VQYLAVWRLAVSISTGGDNAWDRITRAAAPTSPYLFVPAFSLVRPVVQRLGVSLTEAQPALELAQGFAEDTSRRPSLVGVGSGKDGASTAGGGEGDGAPGAAVARPDFGTVSPVVVGRKDARILAHFVYLAVESHEAHDLRSVDYELESLGEELVFIPAAWDPRYVHDSNWRFLLREFDGLVA
jgi:hypothetical protein